MVLGVVPKGRMLRLEPFDLLFREIQLLHSFINPFTQGRAAAMIAAGTLRLAPLISRVVSLEEAVRTIRNPAPAGEIRAIVVPE